MGLLATRLEKVAHIAITPGFWQSALHGVAPTQHWRVPFGCCFQTVIDVGANRGQFALFARNKFPQARILSFEPNPVLIQAVERTGAEVYNLACGSTRGTLRLNVPTRDDDASILGSGDEAVHVKVVRLDEAIEPLEQPALLKLDVQGYELEALKGAEGILDQIDEILCECSYWEFLPGAAQIGDVADFLTQHGFTLKGEYCKTYRSDGSPDQADALFVKSELGGVLGPSRRRVDN